jgi:hypothetical protein
MREANKFTPPGMRWKSADELKAELDQQASAENEKKKRAQLFTFGGALLILVLLIGVIGLFSDTAKRPPTPAPATSPPAIAPPATATPPEKPISPGELREQLAGDYVAIVSTANSHLNFIRQKLTKMKGGGYSLWAVHDMFTQSSFSIGPNAGLVSGWIARNHADLKRAGIVRVGFQNSSGFLGSCYFDVQ